MPDKGNLALALLLTITWLTLAQNCNVPRPNSFGYGPGFGRCGLNEKCVNCRVDCKVTPFEKDGICTSCATTESKFTCSSSSGAYCISDCTDCPGKPLPQSDNTCVAECETAKGFATCEPQPNPFSQPFLSELPLNFPLQGKAVIAELPLIINEYSKYKCLRCGIYAQCPYGKPITTKDGCAVDGMFPPVIEILPDYKATEIILYVDVAISNAASATVRCAVFVNKPGLVAPHHTKIMQASGEIGAAYFTDLVTITSEKSHTFVLNKREWMTPATEYKLYCTGFKSYVMPEPLFPPIQVDQEAVVERNFKTTPPTEPVLKLVSYTPSYDRIYIWLSVNEIATACCVAFGFPFPASPPSGYAVMADRRFKVDCIPDTPCEVTIMGLSTNKRYWVFCAAFDQSFTTTSVTVPPAGIFITTVRETFPPSFTKPLYINNLLGNTVEIHARLSENGNVTCKAYPATAPPPTVDVMVGSLVTISVPCNSVVDCKLTLTNAGLIPDQPFKLYCLAEDENNNLSTVYPPEGLPITSYSCSGQGNGICKAKDFKCVRCLASCSNFIKPEFPGGPCVDDRTITPSLQIVPDTVWSTEDDFGFTVIPSLRSRIRCWSGNRGDLTHCEAELPCRLTYYNMFEKNYKIYCYAQRAEYWGYPYDLPWSPAYPVDGISIAMKAPVPPNIEFLGSTTTANSMTIQMRMNKPVEFRCSVLVEPEQAIQNPAAASRMIWNRPWYPGSNGGACNTGACSLKIEAGLHAARDYRVLCVARDRHNAETPPIPRGGFPVKTAPALFSPSFEFSGQISVSSVTPSSIVITVVLTEDGSVKCKAFPVYWSVLPTAQELLDSSGDRTSPLVECLASELCEVAISSGIAHQMQYRVWCVGIDFYETPSAVTPKQGLAAITPADPAGPPVCSGAAQYAINVKVNSPPGFPEPHDEATLADLNFKWIAVSHNCEHNPFLLQFEFFGYSWHGEGTNTIELLYALLLDSDNSQSKLLDFVRQLEKINPGSVGFFNHAKARFDEEIKFTIANVMSPNTCISAFAFVNGLKTSKDVVLVALDIPVCEGPTGTTPAWVTSATKSVQVFDASLDGETFGQEAAADALIGVPVELTELSPGFDWGALTVTRLTSATEPPSEDNSYLSCHDTAIAADGTATCYLDLRTTSGEALQADEVSVTFTGQNAACQLITHSVTGQAGQSQVPLPIILRAPVHVGAGGDCTLGVVATATSAPTAKLTFTHAVRLAANAIACDAAFDNEATSACRTGATVEEGKCKCKGISVCCTTADVDDCRPELVGECVDAMKRCAVEDTMKSTSPVVALQAGCTDTTAPSVELLDPSKSTLLPPVFGELAVVGSVVSYSNAVVIKGDVMVTGELDNKVDTALLLCGANLQIAGPWTVDNGMDLSGEGDDCPSGVSRLEVFNTTSTPLILADGVTVNIGVICLIERAILLGRDSTLELDNDCDVTKESNIKLKAGSTLKVGEGHTFNVNSILCVDPNGDPTNCEGKNVQVLVLGSLIAYSDSDILPDALAPVTVGHQEEGVAVDFKAKRQTDVTGSLGGCGPIGDTVVLSGGEIVIDLTCMVPRTFTKLTMLEGSILTIKNLHQLTVPPPQLTPDFDIPDGAKVVLNVILAGTNPVTLPSKLPLFSLAAADVDLDFPENSVKLGTKTYKLVVEDDVLTLLLLQQQPGSNNNGRNNNNNGGSSNNNNADQTSSRGSDDDNDNKGWIAAIVVPCGILFLCVLAIAIAFLLRRSKQKSDGDEMFPPKTAYATPLAGYAPGYAFPTTFTAPAPTPSGTPIIIV